jgi:SAM-dependent methyltransferase
MSRQTSPSGGLSVDKNSFRWRQESDSVVDIRFDGRRIWSVDSSELTRRRGWFEVDWPGPILRQLDGRVLIELVEHVTGEVLGAVEASFGDGEERIELVDRAGNPAALTKWGRLVQPFSMTSREAIEQYLDQVEWVIGILRDSCGVPAFLSFGSLLGAVREGKVIAHDVDVDLGYLSSYDNPVDIIRESFRIQRALESEGIGVTRNSGGFLAMNLTQPDGSTRNLDIFTAFIKDGRLHQVNDVDIEGDESCVLPLGTIEFEGRPMPVPANPEVFLVSAYGPEWRVPNPAFSFERPRRQRRRVRGWFGGMREKRDYWARFYMVSREKVPSEPSSFAHWVLEREEPGRLLDLGCGTGRDLTRFAERGFGAVGVDAVPQHARPALKAHEQAKNVELHRLNLESLRDTLTLAALLAADGGSRTVYARFLMHALTDSARENAWRVISMSLGPDKRAYLEFRTDRDRKLKKHFGEHYRRFLVPEAMAAEAASHGLRVVHQDSRRGWSPLGDEDPHLCRMVVERTH